MKILKATRIKEKSSNMDGLEVEIENKGEIKIECFDDYEYWTKIIDGKERFKIRIKENSKQTDNKDNEVKKTEITKYKDVKL